MKVLKPLPHAVIDYIYAGSMIAAPWLFGFSKNKRATVNSVVAGASIAGLSLMTRYPLGAAKLISFPTHGAIETTAGVKTILDPWIMGFSDNKRAMWTHVLSGISTLAVVALTDYQAGEGRQIQPGKRGAGMAAQMANQQHSQERAGTGDVDLGPATHIPDAAWTTGGA